MHGIGHSTARGRSRWSSALFVALCVALFVALVVAGCAATTPPPEPLASAPAQPTETPAQIRARQAKAEAQKRAAARAHREDELLSLIASTNLIAMPELARGRVRATSFAEIAHLRFEGGDVDGALDAVRLGLESADDTGDARLAVPLRQLRFLVLHYAALDAAKKGDTTRSLELFDTIAGLPGLTAAQRQLAGGDRLLVMESVSDPDASSRDQRLKGALARLLGLDDAPAPLAMEDAHAPSDPFAMDSEEVRLALSREIGRDIAEAQLPSMGDNLAAETGRFDPTTVVQIVSANKGSIAACYSQSLRGGGAERGKLELLVRVDPTGEVASSQVVTAQFKSSPLGRCIADTVARWRFPPFAGEARNVELPFVLDYLR